MNVDVSKLTIEELLQIKERLKELDIAIVTTPSKQDRKEKKIAEYSLWDWTRSNNQLASDHNCSMLTVAKWRTALNKPKVKQTKHYPACLSWDWSKSDAALSSELGISLTSICKYRIILNKPKVHQPKRDSVIPAKTERPSFDRINWKQCDTEIAKQTGYTREYVRQKRAQLGIPKYLFQDQKYDAFISKVNGAKQLSFEQARNLTRVSYQTFCKYCTRAGITPIKEQIIKKYPWHLMNWQLPNQLLHQIWNVEAINSVARRRNNHNLGRPLFYTVHHAVPEQFKELVDAEKAKAAQYFATPAPR